MRLEYREWILVLLLFLTGCLVRLIPELTAYPYPIGYDVINYYIPVVTDFASHWTEISSELPLYVSILHAIQIATGINPYSTVVILATITFGGFSISIFLISRKLFKVDIGYAVFVTVFVIFQLAVLRTTWDLHRDVLALTITFFTIVLIHKVSERKKTIRLEWKMILLATILCVIIASTDRMIGFLFIMTLIIYSSITRTKTVILITVVVLTFFTIEVLSTNIASNLIRESVGQPANISSGSSTLYNPTNLIVLFAVLDGILVPTAIIGLRLLKNAILLKIPLLVTGFASFSWIVFPFRESLVADRWIILFGVFLSLFAAYGIFRLIKMLRIRKISYSRSMRPTSTSLFVILPSCILGTFILTGVLYEILPSSLESSILWHGIARNYIESFVPSSMQFNSLPISDNHKMIDAISWINKNTQSNAIIIGEKHWRGFMELYLQGHRTYLFSDSLESLANGLMRQGLKTHVYMIHYSGFRDKNTTIYSNILFSIEKVE